MLVCLYLCLRMWIKCISVYVKCLSSLFWSVYVDELAASWNLSKWNLQEGVLNCIKKTCLLMCFMRKQTFLLTCKSICMTNNPTVYCMLVVNLHNCKCARWLRWKVNLMDAYVRVLTCWLLKCKLSTWLVILLDARISI